MQLFLWVILIFACDAGAKRERPRISQRDVEEARQVLAEIREGMLESTSGVDMAGEGYLSKPFDKLTDYEYDELIDAVGLLGIKLNHHATLIKSFNSGQEKIGNRPSQIGAPLQVNGEDWRLIRALGPILRLAKDNLRDANLSDADLMIAKQIFTAAMGETADVFGAEECRRAQRMISILSRMLLEMPYETFRKMVKPDLTATDAVADLEELRREGDALRPDTIQLEKWDLD